MAMRINGQEDAPWLRCRGCHKTFPASKAWHCGKCHELFEKNTAAEWHLQQGQCVPAERYGWTLENGIWREPMKFVRKK